MRTTTIINARSGAMCDPAADDLRRPLIERAEAAGDVEIVEPDGLAQAIETAIARKPDRILIGGGDGTIKSAAEKLARTEIALGVIPLGTVNRLARDLEIPLDPYDAFDLAVRAAPTAIDMATVNGRYFLNTSCLGVPISIATERERLRRRPLAERIAGYAGILADVARNQRRFDVVVDANAPPHSVRAMSILIANNPFEETAAFPQKRRSLDSGLLALYIARHETGWRLLRSFFGTMLGYWRTDPDLDVHTCPEFVLRSRRGKVMVLKDGEREEIETPLVYRSHGKALRILLPDAAPRHGEATAGQTGVPAEPGPGPGPHQPEACGARA